MEASPLDTIPPELRNAIYELVLKHDESLYFELQRASGGDTNMAPMKAKTNIALTATCKQIRQESLPIFYSVNFFVIDLSLHEHYTHYCKQAPEDFASAMTECFEQVGGADQWITRMDVQLGLWDPLSGMYEIEDIYQEIEQYMTFGPVEDVDLSFSMDVGVGKLGFDGDEGYHTEVIVVLKLKDLPGSRSTFEHELSPAKWGYQLPDEAEEALTEARKVLNKLVDRIEVDYGSE